MPDKGRKDIYLKDLQVTDVYNKFGLNSNPFPVTGIAAGDPGFPPFDYKITKELEAFVHDTYSRRFFGGFVIIGEYGFGKTYVLKHLMRRINESLSLRGEDRACAIYIMNPKSSPEDFVTSILESFGKHQFMVMAWRLVTERLSQEFKSKGESFAREILNKETQLNFFEPLQVSEDFILKQDLLSSPMKFLDEAYRNHANMVNIQKYAEDTFLPIFRAPEIAKGLATIGRRGEAYSSWSEWLNYKQFKSIKKDVSVPEFFHSIMTVFRRNGFRQVYVLIDEFEDIADLGKRERKEYLSRLRDLIEYNLEFFSIVLCVKRQAWGIIAEAHPAFVERFSRRVELKDIGVEQTKRMISEYLRSVGAQAVRKSWAPIYPFTEEAVEELVEKAAGVPRVILEVCFVLLEYAAKENQIIDKEMVAQVESIRESILFHKEPDIDV
jgi:type II secretory pathway predicted ATPase ExeA